VGKARGTRGTWGMETELRYNIRRRGENRESPYRGNEEPKKETLNKGRKRNECGRRCGAALHRVTMAATLRRSLTD